MTKKKREGSVFHPGGVRKLLEGKWEDLTDDEQALVLALASVDAETGGKLDEEERAALDKLMEQVEGYDPEELEQAIQHLITAKSQEGRTLEWPELKLRQLHRRSSEE